MKKILVIQQKMIGDVLVSSLLCEHLKIHFDDSEIHYVVNENTVAVVEHNPYIDRIVVFKNEYKDSTLKFLEFLRSISREGYDVVIDIYGKLESNLITLFSKAKIKITYGKWYLKSIYTHLIPLQPRKPGKTGITVEDRLGLLAPLIDTPLEKKREPTISLTADEIGAAKLFLESQHIDMSRSILMLGILGSNGSKTYPFHYMAQLIDTIAERIKGTLLFNYIPSQQSEAQKLYDLCSEKTKANIAFDTFAPSLRKFLGLLHHCKALIGNEGGAINMAKALG
ncbi:glycosyltransferase family 9 protein, partial [Pricia sp.]|uniref:glycosyltransferase family 9 protein n=1 Tax=Pricia sp. TaxID=2268138 RepID=UPI003594786F